MALVLLLLKGYRLRHRNWRGGGAEKFLVMQQRDTVVFVEVKTRSGMDFGGAAAALDEGKRRHLVRAAAAYLSRHSLWNGPCRFDLVTIEGRGRPWRWRVRHMRSAFRPDLGRQL